MSCVSLPYLSHITTQQGRVDRLGWTNGRTFSAYGLCFCLRSNTPAGLEQAAAHLPLGWHAAPSGEVDILYSLRLAPPGNPKGRRSYHLLYCDAVLVARSLDLAPLLIALEHHAELLTAWLAQDCLFVHAGVVGWQGRAILIPGRSMSGKTTLVQALVEGGAAYYSDEFAVLDKEGRVHPYPVPLSLRSHDGRPARKTLVETLGGQTGVEPLPVGLVVVTRYRRGSAWRPRKLSPGQALLALMDNTVAARRDPAHSMPILKRAVTNAHALKSQRGEAGEIAPFLLS
jgi:hypothetical protein